jgi:transposase
MGIHGPARRLWPAVAALLPPPSPRASGGRPAISDERVFWLLVLFLRAGCSWAVFDLLLIGSDVSGRTVRRRSRAWRAAGLFETICERFVAEEPDEATGYVDATFIRSRGGGSDEVGLTRHGKGSKLQVIVNGHSRPIAWLLVSANPSRGEGPPQLSRRARAPYPCVGPFGTRQ